MEARWSGKWQGQSALEGTRLEQLTEEMAWPKSKADGGYQQHKAQAGVLVWPKNLHAYNKLRFFFSPNKTKLFCLFKDEKYFLRIRFLFSDLFGLIRNSPSFWGSSGIPLAPICFPQSNKVSG